MKGEYVIESKNDNSSNMFAKLQQQQHHHHHQQQQQQQHHHHQNFHPQPIHPHPHHHLFQVSPQCQTSEDDDTSRSSGGAATNTTLAAGGIANKPTKSSELLGDGASIEVSRRPRGRPPGSKNKPKPPVFITREPEPAMSPYILEVPGGADIVETIARFSRRRNIGLCVLSGSGTVANVSLRQPSNTPASTVIFHGRYDILSISATFLHPTTSSQVPSSANHIAISLAGPQGQIFGGAVAGPLLAAGTVFIIAASFNHPSYHRLPVVEEEAHNSASGGNDINSPPASGGGESGHTPAGDSCGMSMFSCHLPSDVIWAPTARQPQQQQQQQQQPPPPY